MTSSTRSRFLGTMGILSASDQALATQYRKEHYALFGASKSEDLMCDTCSLSVEASESVGCVSGECWGCFKVRNT